MNVVVFLAQVILRTSGHTIAMTKKYNQKPYENDIYISGYVEAMGKCHFKTFRRNSRSGNTTRLRNKQLTRKRLTSCETLQYYEVVFGDVGRVW